MVVTTIDHPPSTIHFFVTLRHQIPHHRRRNRRLLHLDHRTRLPLHPRLRPHPPPLHRHRSLLPRLRTLLPPPRPRLPLPPPPLLLPLLPRPHPLLHPLRRLRPLPLLRAPCASRQ